MKINLEIEEKVELEIEGANYEVWGERNSEGTLIIKSNLIF